MRALVQCLAAIYDNVPTVMVFGLGATLGVLAMTEPSDLASTIAWWLLGTIILICLARDLVAARILHLTRKEQP